MDRTFIPTNIPNIPRMHALAMKKIFDPSFSAYEEAELEGGINKWVHRGDLSPVDRLELNRIINALIADKEGNTCFDQAKWLIRAKGFKYQNIFKAGLPYIKLDPLSV